MRAIEFVRVPYRLSNRVRSSSSMVVRVAEFCELPLDQISYRRRQAVLDGALESQDRQRVAPARFSQQSAVIVPAQRAARRHPPAMRGRSGYPVGRGGTFEALCMREQLGRKPLPLIGHLVEQGLQRLIGH